MACALDSGGAAYCWADDAEGEIGDEDTSEEQSGVPEAVDTSGVLAGKTLTQITAADQTTCAVDSVAPPTAGAATAPSVPSATEAATRVAQRLRWLWTQPECSPARLSSR
jgi:hypothetical protein